MPIHPITGYRAARLTGTMLTMYDPAHPGETLRDVRRRSVVLRRRRLHG